MQLILLDTRKLLSVCYLRVSKIIVLFSFFPPRFDVSIKERRFFAFLKYKEVMKDVVLSICNVTFTGWVRDEVDKQHPMFPVKNWGCYYG